jgi:hypothetical protein
VIQDRVGLRWHYRTRLGVDLACAASEGAGLAIVLLHGLVDAAVVEPAARAVFADFDIYVSHFELVEENVVDT